jgi:hypothetical protein
MAYRKVKIGDTTHLYSVGREYTKVRGVGVFMNSKIGNPVRGHDDMFVITPRNIRHALLNQPIPVLTCEEHGVSTTELTMDPLEFEVGNRKIKYMISCMQCYNQLAAEI